MDLRDDLAAALGTPKSDAPDLTDFMRSFGELTRTLEENSVWRKPVGCIEQIFCGTFVAKVYVGQQIKGTYKFDCTDFNAKVIPDNARVRLTKVA